MKGWFACLVTAAVFLTGCGNAESADTGTQTQVPAETSKPADIVEGTFIAQAITYNGSVVSFADNKEVADLYDTNWVTVNNDGTFSIQNGAFTSTGTWDRIKIDGYDNSFLFAQKETSRMTSDKETETTSDEKTFIGFLMNDDTNTFVLLEKGAESADMTLIYVREGEESIHLSGSSGNSTASTVNTKPQETSSQSNNSSSSQSSPQKKTYKFGLTEKDYIEYSVYVNKWIQERFEYYDQREGYYTGDKYDNEVFEDACEKFGKSRSEIEEIYDDGAHYIAAGY